MLDFDEPGLSHGGELSNAQQVLRVMLGSADELGIWTGKEALFPSKSIQRGSLECQRGWMVVITNSDVFKWREFRQLLCAGCWVGRLKASKLLPVLPVLGPTGVCQCSRWLCVTAVLPYHVLRTASVLQVWSSAQSFSCRENFLLSPGAFRQIKRSCPSTFKRSNPKSCGVVWLWTSVSICPTLPGNSSSKAKRCTMPRVRQYYFIRRSQSSPQGYKVHCLQSFQSRRSESEQQTRLLLTL